MTQQTFLVEIGTEELPPKALRSLAESFAANFTAELDNAGLEHGDVSWFAAPRRLALKVANLSAAQADREIEKRGPAIAQAFDAEGKPSKAAEGWARGCGITVDQAERLVRRPVLSVLRPFPPQPAGAPADCGLYSGGVGWPGAGGGAESGDGGDGA